MASTIDLTALATPDAEVSATIRDWLTMHTQAKADIEAHEALIAGLSAGTGLPATIINVMGGSGVANDDTEHAATLAGINTLIANLNAASNPQAFVLYFPPGRYGIDGPLTAADGDYSIIMDPGAAIWDHGAKNAVMWRIGNPAAQADGHGIVRFVLAAEGRGNNDYDNANNVAFEIVNVQHYSAFIRQAYKFVTGLRLIADGTGATHQHYDAQIQLGYLHNTRQSVVLITQNANGAWLNNIRFHGGDFSPATGMTPGSELALRYISAISGAGECKAVFHDPLCDAADFVALYSSNGTVQVLGGHMEDPNWVIQHASGVASAGAEPCTWVAPRLEAKQFLIDDPDDVGSYAYDPFWGPAPTPRPKALTASRDLTVGDIRAQRLLYNPGASTFALTIQELSAASEPPLMAEVRLQRRSTGTLTVAAGANVTLLVPSGSTAGLVQGGEAVLRFIDLTAGAQVWSLSGDLT